MELDGIALNANPLSDVAKAQPFVGVIIYLVVLHLPLHWVQIIEFINQHIYLVLWHRVNTDNKERFKKGLS